MLCGDPVKNSVVSVIKEYLEREGFAVTIVDSYGPLDAVYVELSRHGYTAVLPTNLGLRPEPILELVSKIREKFEGVKIVVVSGYDPLAFVTELRRCGVDDFLVAPFKLEYLRRRIRFLLSSY